MFGAFRYADCQRWYRDPRLSSIRPRSNWIGPGVEPEPFESLIDHMQRWLLVAAPARHGWLRRALNPGFSPAMLEQLEPRIVQVVDELVAEFGDGGEVDLVRDLTYPLPVHVISMLLGIPRPLRQRMVELSSTLAVWFGSMAKTADECRAAQEAIGEMSTHFLDLVGRNRDGGGDELLELLVRAKIRTAVRSRTPSCARSSSCCCSRVTRRPGT